MMDEESAFLKTTIKEMEDGAASRVESYISTQAISRGMAELRAACMRSDSKAETKRSTIVLVAGGLYFRLAHLHCACHGVYLGSSTPTLSAHLPSDP